MAEKQPEQLPAPKRRGLQLHVAEGGEDLLGIPPLAQPEPQQAEPTPQEEPVVEQRAEPAPQEQQVPKERLDSVITERETAKAEAKKLQAELAQLRKERAEMERDAKLQQIASGESLPDGYEEWSEPKRMAWMMKELSQQPEAEAPVVDDGRIERLEMKLDLRDQGFSKDQVEAVLEARESLPQLELAELVAVLKQRSPDLFAQGESASADALPPSHVTQRPGRSMASAPPGSSNNSAYEQAKADFDAARDSGDRRKMDRAGAKMFGEMLREGQQ